MLWNVNVMSWKVMFIPRNVLFDVRVMSHDRLAFLWMCVERLTGVLRSKRLKMKHIDERPPLIVHNIWRTIATVLFYELSLVRTARVVESD